MINLRYFCFVVIQLYLKVRALALFYFINLHHYTYITVSGPNEAVKMASALCLKRQKCALSPNEAVKIASTLCLKRQKCAPSPNEAVKMASALCLECKKCVSGPNEAVNIAGKNNI